MLLGAFLSFSFCAPCCFALWLRPSRDPNRSRAASVTAKRLLLTGSPFSQVGAAIADNYRRHARLVTLRALLHLPPHRGPEQRYWVSGKGRGSLWCTAPVSHRSSHHRPFKVAGASLISFPLSRLWAGIRVSGDGGLRETERGWGEREMKCTEKMSPPFVLLHFFFIFFFFCIIICFILNRNKL